MNINKNLVTLSKRCYFNILNYGLSSEIVKYKLKHIGIFQITTLAHRKIRAGREILEIWNPALSLLCSGISVWQESGNATGMMGQCFEIWFFDFSFGVEMQDVIHYQLIFVLHLKTLQHLWQWKQTIKEFLNFLVWILLIKENKILS